MAVKEEEGRAIFISYGREVDVKYFVRQLKRDLEANGFSVWLDVESIPSGSDWHGAIGTGLHECTAFIPIITQKYIGSRYCMNELYMADGDQKLIFPIMYEDVDLVSTEAGRALKFIVSGINWTMFRPGQDDYSDSLQKLIKGMKDKEKEEAQKALTEAKEEPVVITVGPTSSEPLKMISGIEYPARIATGRNGEIIVASYMSHKVHVYSHDYQLLRTFGSNGYLDGQFMCPSGIAVDRHNRIFVSSMTKVDVFTMEGQFLAAVGQQGKGPLEFTNAAGVAVGKQSEVYVADAQNNRIQVLNSDLTYRTSFSEACKTLGSGCLSQPQDIAINSEGNLYIADMMNHAVQAFTPDGKFLLKFGKYGPATTLGAVCTPMAITIDGEDNVYVGNSTGTICIFDKQGSFLRQFGSYGSELGQFNQIRGMHIDRKGRLYVSEWTSNRIQIFPGSPSMEEQEGEGDAAIDEPEAEGVETFGLSKPAYLIGPSSSLPTKVLSGIRKSGGIAAGKNGEVVVISEDLQKVFVYSSKNDYQLFAEVGGKGDLDRKFSTPSGVAVTPDNLIIVSSYNKLQWFTMEGNLVYAVGSRGKEEMEFNNPTDIAIGRDGRIYVIDMNNKRVQILNGDATYHSCFSFPLLDPEKDRTPGALAINSEGNLYFADASNHCVHVLSSHGERLFKFGKQGSMLERGTLVSPMAIAIDIEDNVFVASMMMITIFNKSGSLIRAFGSNGSDPGQFNYIKGLHVGNNGYLYVSEYSNNRVQIFEGSEPSQFSEEERSSNRIQIFPGSPSMEEQKGEGDAAIDEPEAEGVKTFGLSKPAYLIGPSSSLPTKVLSGIRKSGGIAAGKNGEVVVISEDLQKVFVYSSKNDYQLFAEVGGKGDLDGKFSTPSGVAVTPDNLIIVSSYNKLQWFTMEGNLVYAVGSRGKEEMEFNNPTDIAIGRDGRIYVIDMNNKRVQILNGDATYHSCFSFPLLDPEKDRTPGALAINSEGNLYFADASNHCVHVLSSRGERLFKFGKQGSMLERGTLVSPMAIAIDIEDNVFVASMMMITIFNKSGSLIRAFGSNGSDPGQFNYIKGLHVGKNGYLYVSEYSNNRVQIFEGSEPSQFSEEERDTLGGNFKSLSSRRPVYTIGPTDVPVKILSGMMEPGGVTTTLNGDVFVVSNKGRKVVIYNSHDYEFKGEIGRLVWETTRDNDMVSPKGIAVCEKDSLLISFLNQLVKISMLGDVIASVGKKGRGGKGDTELDSPNGIAVGRDSRIYVVDSGNKRLQIFNADLSYNSTCQWPDSQHRGVYMEKVAVNSQGSVYVTDKGKDCVHVFNCDGKFLFHIRNSGDRWSISSPVAIAIDHEDYVYISDSSIGISIFNREGCFVRAFGIRGGKPGQFLGIKAMHIDHEGNLYVCEDKNDRVQIFEGIKSQEQGEKDRDAFLAQEEAKVDILPVRVLPDGIREPHGIAEGRNGEIVVASSSDNKGYVYDCYHRLVVQFGDTGERDGQFNVPTGVAVTSDNYILVSSHDKLQWFTMKGQLVYAVGVCGKKEMEFDHPDSIAIANDGRIYVLERRNKRVQILKGDATYHSSFSLTGYLPEALAVNSEGKVFFAYARCIQIYSSEGNYLSKFYYHMDSKELTLPTAIAIDTDDSVYVGTASGVVAVFDKVGCFVRSFRGSGNTPGQFSVIKGVHVGRSGCIYVSDYSNNRVQVFGESEVLVPSAVDLEGVSSLTLPYRPFFTIGPTSPLPVKILKNIQQPSGITTDKNGKIFITSARGNKILIYGPMDSQPRSEITEIKNVRDPRNKRMHAPTGLALTSDGYLLVSFQHRLVKIAQDGTAVAFFGNENNRAGSKDEELYCPDGIAMGKDGLIYLVDRGNHRIQTFKSNLTFATSYFNPDSKERSVERLECVALNSAGDLYVTDGRNCNVQVYKHDGKFMFAFGKAVNKRQYRRVELSKLRAIAIDQDDFVYVGGEDGVVSIFDKRGCFVRSFGRSGDQPGQFGNIQAMYIDRHNQLYVSEWKNNRVQVFQLQCQYGFTHLLYENYPSM